METLTPPTLFTIASDADTFIDTAAHIGRLLCRDAIWQGERCNFLSSTNDPAFEYPRPYFKSLEADFYSGSTGVGFFLAGLYHATGDRLVRKTALGTLRNTLATAHAIQPTAQLGFFSGLTGIAFTAIQAGYWLNDDNLGQQGQHLLHELTNLNLQQTGIDVIDGAAGAIPALIQLERTYPSSALRTFIGQLADELTSRAESSAEGYSWNTLPGSGFRNLTGWAHGVAGIANALLEAFTLTGNVAYRNAAFEGLRYENAFFDQQQQNWPDFRMQEQPQAGTQATEPPERVCSCAWCHGAPGIALSRLRGYELTQNPALRAEAETAVRTTAQQLNWEQQQNFSLCHGLAGNADVLLEAADIVQAPAWRQQAEAIGQLGQERFRKTGLWTSGLYNDYQIPDFMLGMAGTGYFYLRLANPALYRSVLLLR